MQQSQDYNSFNIHELIEKVRQSLRQPQHNPTQQPTDHHSLIYQFLNSIPNEIQPRRGRPPGSLTNGNCKKTRAKQKQSTKQDRNIVKKIIIHLRTFEFLPTIKRFINSYEVNGASVSFFARLRIFLGVTDMVQEFKECINKPQNLQSVYDKLKKIKELNECQPVEFYKYWYAMERSLEESVSQAITNHIYSNNKAGLMKFSGSPKGVSEEQLTKDVQSEIQQIREKYEQKYGQENIESSIFGDSHWQLGSTQHSQDMLITRKNSIILELQLYG